MSFVLPLYTQAAKEQVRPFPPLNSSNKKPVPLFFSLKQQTRATSRGTEPRERAVGALRGLHAAGLPAPGGAGASPKSAKWGRGGGEGARRGAGGGGEGGCGEGGEGGCGKGGGQRVGRVGGGGGWGSRRGRGAEGGGGKRGGEMPPVTSDKKHNVDVWYVRGSCRWVFCTPR